MASVLIDNSQMDVQIVPVSLSYELPMPQVPQSFMDYFKVFLGFWPTYGSVRVDFDQPFSLREFDTYWNKKLGNYEGKKIFRNDPHEYEQ